MAVTMADVRRALDPDEVDYPQAAAELGEDALPFLRELVSTPEPGLAAKAAYLAGLIGGAAAEAVVSDAASHGDPRVRAAAAATAGFLEPAAAGRVVAGLVQDADAGVQKLALRSVPADPDPGLRDSLRQVSQNAPHAVLRQLASDALGD